MSSLVFRDGDYHGDEEESEEGNEGVKEERLLRKVQLLLSARVFVSTLE
jgi:hypothetical protein